MKEETAARHAGTLDYHLHSNNDKIKRNYKVNQNSHKEQKAMQP